MRIRMFYHTLLSDWNHGNAHFLRGIATELISRGHEVRVYEPEDSWSRRSLLAEHGDQPIKNFYRAYPHLDSVCYRPGDDLEAELHDADVVIVHEWNDADLVAQIGYYRKSIGTFNLFFHDTHHRMVTAPDDMRRYDLSRYDGVLAYGNVLRDLYLDRELVQRAWTWHEAADTRVFHPRAQDEFEGDLVWIGNWGDDERTAELHEFLIEPVKTLGLKARVYGVRYPEAAMRALAEAGIEYGGWLPNFEAPNVFSKFKVTVHVPRRPYVKALPGIPTIRPFEAMACGIPLISSPWNDCEHLFTPGKDFLVAQTGQQMTRQIKNLLSNEDLAQNLADHAFKTICSRHTCAHRVDQLLNICDEVRAQNPEGKISP
ncbi:MAG: glycosyltransferase [Verrucomicrobiales bacterium]|nr:glycosyltransferase [Verrucomicrobiales bacterium]